MKESKSHIAVPSKRDDREWEKEKIKKEQIKRFNRPKPVKSPLNR